MAVRGTCGLRESRTDVGPLGSGSTMLICGEGIQYSGTGFQHVDAFRPRRIVNALSCSRSIAVQNDYVHDWRTFEAPDDQFGHWMQAELRAMSPDWEPVCVQNLRKRTHTDASIRKILLSGPTRDRGPSAAYCMLYRLVANPELTRECPAIDRAAAMLIGSAAPGSENLVEVSRYDFSRIRSSARAVLLNMGRLAEYVFCPDRIPTIQDQKSSVRRLCDACLENPALLEHRTDMVFEAARGRSFDAYVIASLRRRVAEHPQQFAR